MRRRYVWEQTADHLREGIRNGTWTEYLPPERLLSEELRVSRDPLRLAISSLRKEGWIEKSGRRHKVRTQGEDSAGADRQVIMVSPLYPAETSHLFLEVLGRLRDSMGRQDIPVSLQTVPALASRRPGQRLQNLVENLPRSLWILHHAEKAAQEWFARSNQPVAILGTGWTELPGVDLDHVAMGRHCLGLLRRRLNKEPRVILFRPNRDLAGLAETERLMSQELQHFQVVIDRSEDCFVPTSIERFNRCDVVITATARQAIGLSGWLDRKLGRRVGQDVSVISLAGSPVLQFAWPSIAHYAVDGANMERRLRKVIHRLDKGHPCGKPAAIMPDFIDGASLAKA